MVMKKSLLVASLLAFAMVPCAQASEAQATKGGCMACHAKDKKVLGPSFRDIAAKYKDQKDIEAKLIDKVRKGGSGSFGPMPMSPNGPDKISDDDLKAVVEWILKGAA
jgi:cytochrome c